MQLTLDIKKSIEQNAEVYFEKAKKARKKIKGAEEAIAKAKERLERLKKESEKEKSESMVIVRKKEWYEKFRWFVSSEDFLCIGGRDATTNDIIVRKYMEPSDIVLHTEIAGSPFFIIKTKGKEAKATIKEAAQATASFSRAWKYGLAATEVYWIKPEQVKKEFGLPKGTFMIYGKRNYLTPTIKISIGITKNGAIMAAPEEAAKKHCTAYVNIKQGNVKKSDCAKKIRKILEDRSKIKINLDDVMAAMPPGDCEVEQ